MQKKKVFISKLSKITNGMLKKDIASIMGCTTETLSKYLNPEMKNFPNVEELYLLCEHFHVSIDWILGREEKKQINKKPSDREIFEFIKNLCENNQCNFTDISVYEDCYLEYIDNDGNHSVDYKKRKNHYNAFYFSEWNQDIEQYPFYNAESDGGNYNEHARHINRIINIFLKFKEMYDNGYLSYEKYEEFMDSLLEE